MPRSIARWVALLVAACVMQTAGPASARGRRHVGFRVDVRTGVVETLAQAPQLPAERSWPQPAGDRRRITADKGTVQVFEGDPAVDTPIWQFAIPGAGDGWSPWQLVQGNTVAFVWRDAMPGRPYEFRDIARAVDMTRGNVLWERIGPAHDPPGAATVGADHMVVDEPTEVVVLETRTGRVVRRLGAGEHAFAAASPSSGRVWIEAGDVIECIDARTAKPIWRASKQGELRALVPVPGTDDWLVKTTSRTYRWRAADGRQWWSAPSASSSRPVLAGGRLYEGTLVEEDRHRRARISLIARDVRTGKVIDEYQLGRHDMFFDQSTVVAIEARDGHVDVVAEFILLD